MKRSTRRELERRLPLRMHMSENFRELMRRASESGKDLLGRMLLFYDAGLRTALAKHPDRRGIAAGAHDAIDRCMRQLLATDEKAPEVKCRRGCTACCHMPVSVSRCEAELLAAVVVDEHRSIDRDRLRLQASSPIYQGLSREDRACVFLSWDGSCSVYEHRPGACRKLLVVTDPDLCDTVKHPGGRVGGLVSAEAEVVWTVLMTRDRPGTLPQLLLEELEASDAQVNT